MSKFLIETRDFAGEKEVKIFLECKKLVEQLLRENEIFLEHLNKNNKPTQITRYNIARMEYALGKTDKKPNPKNYFNFN